MILKTIEQYQAVRNSCRDIFIKKTKDYGTSWRVLRPISIVDQLYIKAWRIRSIQEAGGFQKINEGIDEDFMAIVNYGYIALIQLQLDAEANWELTVDEALRYYNEQASIIEQLMIQKNHDYGEAWRNMSQQSFVDLILTKLLRIRQIIENDGQTLISEGVDANFFDIVNYALFALIRQRFDVAL